MSFRDRLSRYTPKSIGTLPGDFYVSPNGSDAGDGSLAHPFRSIERAAEAVRQIKDKRTGCISVCLMAGEYITDGIRFTEEDSGRDDLNIVYRAYDDGEVIINGGVSLNPADFEHIPENIRERLHGDARDHVMQIDLKRYGLTSEDWGPLCPIGKYSMHDKYDNHIEDSNCELFLNGRYSTCEVRVNGVYVDTMMFRHHTDLKPYLREGDNTISLKLCNTLRNLLGPHHLTDPEPYGVGPGNFTLESQWQNESHPRFVERYSFVRFGVDC